MVFSNPSGSIGCSVAILIRWRVMLGMKQFQHGKEVPRIWNIIAWWVQWTIFEKLISQTWQWLIPILARESNIDWCIINFYLVKSGFFLLYHLVKTRYLGASVVQKDHPTTSWSLLGPAEFWEGSKYDETILSLWLSFPESSQGLPMEIFCKMFPCKHRPRTTRLSCFFGRLGSSVQPKKAQTNLPICMSRKMFINLCLPRWVWAPWQPTWNSCAWHSSWASVDSFGGGWLHLFSILWTSFPSNCPLKSSNYSWRIRCFCFTHSKKTSALGQYRKTGDSGSESLKGQQSNNKRIQRELSDELGNLLQSKVNHQEKQDTHTHTTNSQIHGRRHHPHHDFVSSRSNLYLLHPSPPTRLSFGTRGSFHIKSWSRLWCLWHLGGAVAQNDSHGDVQVSWQSIGDVQVNMEIWGFTRQNISDISWIEWMIIMNMNDKCKKLQSSKVGDGDWSIFSMWRVWES